MMKEDKDMLKKISIVKEDNDDEIKIRMSSNK